MRRREGGVRGLGRPEPSGGVGPGARSTTRLPSASDRHETVGRADAGVDGGRGVEAEGAGEIIAEIVVPEGSSSARRQAEHPVDPQFGCRGAHDPDQRVDRAGSLAAAQRRFDAEHRQAQVQPGGVEFVGGDLFLGGLDAERGRLGVARTEEVGGRVRVQNGALRRQRGQRSGRAQVVLGRARCFQANRGQQGREARVAGVGVVRFREVVEQRPGVREQAGRVGAPSARAA